ncbi:MAG: sulfatase-like hydrolase/transferase [Pirellulaceae bacterium]
MMVRLLLLILAIGFSATGFAQTVERPNFIFLLADDQRVDTIAAWGNSEIQTPNLDTLVQRGLSFRANYNLGGSNGAVCIASRAMIYSGRAWVHSPDNIEGVTTFPERLRSAGYHTFHTGKWHNGQESLARSYSSGENVFLGGMCDHTQVKTHSLRDGNIELNATNETFSSQLFADAAIAFLETRPSDQPFLLSVCFTAPHDPRQPPLPYREPYYASLPSLPNNFLPQHPFDNGQLVLRDEVLTAWPRKPEVIQQQLAEYYGMVTHMDEQIGRILESLAKSGSADNTYIIYAADHGLALGSHGLLGKQSLYEHSSRSPLIVVGPGISADQTTTAKTYLLDIGATLLDLAGVDALPEIDGKSFRSVLENPQAEFRTSIGLAYTRQMRAFRDGDWKLIVYPPINHVQLFNLKDDPDEKNDLAGLPEHVDRLQKLKSSLEHWQQSYDDICPLTVENPKPKQIDLTGKERKPDQWQPEWIVEKYFGDD